MRISKKKKRVLEKKKGIKIARWLVSWACFLNNYSQYTAEIMPRPNLIYFV